MARTPEQISAGGQEATRGRMTDTTSAGGGGSSSGSSSSGGSTSTTPTTDSRLVTKNGQLYLRRGSQLLKVNVSGKAGEVSYTSGGGARVRSPVSGEFVPVEQAAAETQKIETQVKQAQRRMARQRVGAITRVTTAPSGEITYHGFGDKSYTFPSETQISYTARDRPGGITTRETSVFVQEGDVIKRYSEPAFQSQFEKEVRTAATETILKQPSYGKARFYYGLATTQTPFGEQQVMVPGTGLAGIKTPKELTSSEKSKIISTSIGGLDIYDTRKPRRYDLGIPDSRDRDRNLAKEQTAFQKRIAQYEAIGKANLASQAPQRFFRRLASPLIGMGKLLYVPNVFRDEGKVVIKYTKKGEPILKYAAKVKPIIGISQERLFGVKGPIYSDPDVQTFGTIIGAGALLAAAPPAIAATAGVGFLGFTGFKAVTSPSPESLADLTLASAGGIYGAKYLKTRFSKPKITGVLGQKAVTREFTGGKISEIRAAYKLNVGRTPIKVAVPRGREISIKVTGTKDITVGAYKFRGLGKLGKFEAFQRTSGFTKRKPNEVFSKDFFELYLPTSKTFGRAKLIGGMSKAKARQISIDVQGLKTYETVSSSFITKKGKVIRGGTKRFSPEAYANYLKDSGKIGFETPEEIFTSSRTLGRYGYKNIEISPYQTPAQRKITIAHELIHFKTKRLEIPFETKLPYRLQPQEIIAFSFEKTMASKGFKVPGLKTRYISRPLYFGFKKPKVLAAERGIVSEVFKTQDITITQAKISGVYGKSAKNFLKFKSKIRQEQPSLKFISPKPKSKFANAQVTKQIKKPASVLEAKAIVSSRRGAEQLAKSIVLRQQKRISTITKTTKSTTKVKQLPKVETAIRSDIISDTKIISRTKQRPETIQERISSTRILSRLRLGIISESQLKQIPKTKIGIKQIQKEQLTLVSTLVGGSNYNLRLVPPPPPPPPPPPIKIKFEAGMPKIKKKKDKIGKPLRKYQPSLVGVARPEIKIPRPKLLTGLRVRPL